MPKYNPFTQNFDYIQDNANSEIGSVNNPFPSTGFYMYDTDGNLWIVTIDNTGQLTTTIGEPAGGEIFGLWSFLPRTYSE